MSHASWRCRLLADTGAERDELSREFDVPDCSRLCPGLALDATLLVAEGRLLRLRAIESNGQSAEPEADVEAVAAAAGWDHELAVRPDGTLLGRGWNSHGQAGQLAADYLQSWRPAFAAAALPQVAAVAAGEKHSLLLTKAGEVFAWGSNADGQLGLGAEPYHAAQPHPVHLGTAVSGTETGVRAIACGARHSCALTQAGQLYCWGWSLHGQCGCGEPAVWQPRPVPELQGLGISQVAAGLAHTLALSACGDVYSWGWNGDGQLGLGDTSDRSRPELVEALGQPGTTVAKVACGARHSIALTACGRAFGCGCAKHGELGGGWEGGAVPSFQALPGSEAGRVADVACGWWHTALLLRPPAAAADARTEPCDASAAV